MARHPSCPGSRAAIGASARTRRGYRTIRAVQAAFAAYHDPIGPDGRLQIVRMLALLVAGSYFGLVYIVRGFGIVVAVHAIYDILALIVLKPPHG